MKEKDLMGIINLATNPNGCPGDRIGLLTLCQDGNHLELRYSRSQGLQDAITVIRALLSVSGCHTSE